MRTRPILAVCAAVCAVAVPAGAATADGGGHTTPLTICHKGQTITVDVSAWWAHKKHGDVKGECPPPNTKPTVPEDTTPEPEPTVPEDTTPDPEPEPEPTVPEDTTPEPEPEPEPTTPVTEPEPEPTVPVTEPEPAPTTPDDDTEDTTPPPAAPEDPQTPPAAPTSDTPDGELPATGAEHWVMAALAAVFTAAGFGTIRLARRP